MTPWSLPALLLLGLMLGRHGLDLMTPSVIQLLDPLVAMALAMIGVFVGLSLDLKRPAAARRTIGIFDAMRRPRINISFALAAAAGLVTVILRDSSPAAVLGVLVSLTGAAVITSVAAWLLIGQAESEREQQVFVVGSLLLTGGAAAYLSVSALFVGLLAGMVWNVADDVARTRIVKELDYFQHPLVVLLLVVAGASLSMSLEVVALALAVLLVQLVSPAITHPFPVSAGLVAIALIFDVIRGGGV